ncbi:MAG: lytic transglycosylase domain-containing protein [Gaiellaceae bacterium]
MTRVVGAVVVLAAAAGVFAYVQETKPAPYARLLYPLEYETIITGHARNYRLDPALLAAVIYQESRFRADAESPSGAIGLMQVLPDTAKGIAVRTGGSRFRVADLYEPEINVRYGSWYLRHLIDKYGGLEPALAAYNAGQANVDRWLADGGGIRFTETRRYVDEVLENRDLYARTYPQLAG